MDNRCQKDSCSALGGFSVSCVIRNIPVSVDLLKVIQTKYGFDYGALRTGICGCAVIWSVFYCSEKYLSDSWQMSNDHAKLGFQGEKNLKRRYNPLVYYGIWVNIARACQGHYWPQDHKKKWPGIFFI